ncbi:hypothetical protein DAI22_07g187800 [Oryza sativa Japonica Group]|nr:hypothetical protein DAI22_07g187800 [Oryza sativa Japonica Group]
MSPQKIRKGNSPTHRHSTGGGGDFERQSGIQSRRRQRIGGDGDLNPWRTSGDGDLER